MSIETYLNQLASLRRKAGLTKYGKPTYYAEETIKVRVTEELSKIVTIDGNNVSIDAEMWILPDQSIGVDDRLTYDNQVYVVKRVDITRDIDGDINHKKVLLQKDSSTIPAGTPIEDHISNADIHFEVADIVITKDQISDYEDVGAVWGNITGTLSDQTDLQQALDLKADSSSLSSHTGDDTIHFTQSQISITESQISDLGSYLTAETDPIFSASEAANFVSGDKFKLDGIEASANNYSLPVATDSILGGIKIGERLKITDGVLSADNQITSPAGSSGQIQFNSSGSFGADSNLVWDNVNKRLGIGTTSPTDKLEVSGGNLIVDRKNLIKGSGAINYSTIKLNTDLAGFVLNAHGGFTFRTQYADATGPFIWKEVNTEFMRFESKKVGIGTATLNSRLTVKGSGNTSATNALNITDSTDNSLLFVRDDGNVGIGKTPTQKLDVNGTILGTSFHIGGGANLINTDSGYTRLHGTGGVKLTTWNAGYVDALVVAPTTGNVGILTSSPDFPLQVNGTIAPETTLQDLGTASLRWDLFAGTIDASDNIITAADKAFYLGAVDTDGSWRINLSGNDLAIERRESGAWVQKSVVTA